MKQGCSETSEVQNFILRNIAITMNLLSCVKSEQFCKYFFFLFFTKKGTCCANSFCQQFWGNQSWGVISMCGCDLLERGSLALLCSIDPRTEQKTPVALYLTVICKCSPINSWYPFTWSLMDSLTITCITFFSLYEF